MAKDKTQKYQHKIENPKAVESVTQQMGLLSDGDKGAVLRKIGVTYLQSRWRPLIPTPELRPVINMLGRLSTLINLVMRLFTSRKLPVEDLAVVSEAKIREDVIEPVVEILQAKCREIEKVLDKNQAKSKANTKAKGEKTRPLKSKVDTEKVAAEPEATIESEVAAQG